MQTGTPLIVLVLQIHQHKYEFNQRLLTLRDKKLQVITTVRDLILQLQDVHHNLDESHQQPLPDIPVMHPDELPEK